MRPVPCPGKRSTNDLIKSLISLFTSLLLSKREARCDETRRGMVFSRWPWGPRAQALLQRLSLWFGLSGWLCPGVFAGHSCAQAFLQGARGPTANAMPPVVEKTLPIALEMAELCPTELAALRELTRKKLNTTPRRVLGHHTTKWCQPAHGSAPAQYSLKAAGLDVPIEEGHGGWFPARRTRVAFRPGRLAECARVLFPIRRRAVPAATALAQLAGVWLGSVCGWGRLAHDGLSPGASNQNWANFPVWFETSGENASCVVARGPAIPSMSVSDPPCGHRLRK